MLIYGWHFCRVYNLNRKRVNKMTYIIDTVANLTDTIITEAAKQNQSVIKFKNKEKKGYFFVAPAVTPAFVQVFAANPKGLEAMQDYIESLIKGVGKKRFDSGLHFSEADCTVEALAEFAMQSSENVRLTKENITSAFESGWVNTIAYALVLERDAGASAILLGEDMEAKQAFWASPVGEKFVQIATNYKQFLLYGAERKPAFQSQAIKDKVLQAVAYLDQEEQLVQKLSEKLNDAPIASADLIAL